MPQALYEQLAIGGIMVLPIGPDRGDQRLLRVTRTAEGPRLEELGAVRFVPLRTGIPSQEEASAEAADAEPDAARLA
jgi:protein-L-isoaspartate(D-aspartate) O-methyltransferase